MRLRQAFASAAAVLLFGACGSQPTPRPQPMPTPDDKPPLLTPEPRSPRLANYQIQARYDAETFRIQATQTLTWTHGGHDPVDALPFHLYMNAFKNEDSVFMRESRGVHRGERASEDGWGWIEVDSIRIDGRDATAAARFPGPDETVLEVPLAAPVAPGQVVRVDMTFQVQLPEVFARTGHKGEFALVGQWFPKIGVRVGAPGAETWHCEPFHLNSEFFADFGTYEVDLTVPETHVVAATGVLAAAEDHGDGTRTLRYQAADVHDFVWMADPYMRYVSQTAMTELGPVEVRVYHRPRQEAFARRHLRAGVGAIETFSRLYVTYPWPIMSIIDPPPRAAGGAGGMEYPTMVTTAADSVFMRPGVRMPEYITVHEVGHNWFQGVLATNEVDEAWMDEGINEYADGLVMAEVYGSRTSIIDWLGWEADMRWLRRASAGQTAALPMPIATRSYEFPDFGAYGGATYGKTAMALSTLEAIVGAERFHAAMKVYAQTWAFKHPTEADLWDTLERELGEDLDWFVEPAFHDIGAADLRIRDHRCRKAHDPRGVFGRGEDRELVTRDDAPDGDTWICEVLLTNVGTVPVVVDIDVRFDDGSVAHERWDGRDGGTWKRLIFEHTAKIAEVLIDPDKVIAINDNAGARGERAEPDTSASRRAGARVQFWTQSAMQVVGL